MAEPSHDSNNRCIVRKELVNPNCYPHQSAQQTRCETASKLTFIKHNLMLEHANLFKKPKQRNKSDEPDSEEEENVEENNIVEEIDEFDGLFDEE